MKRFVVPPAWPSPPRRSWVPPKTWRPDPSWAPPPEGWRFWVDGKGKPVRGPIGRYGSPSRRVMYAGAGALVLFLGVNIWAVSALGLFGGDSGDPQAVQVVDDSTPTPSATTPTPVVPQTTTPPLVPKTTVTPTQKPTQRPTQTRTTERRTEEPPDPTPTQTTTTAKKTPKPSRTSQPPTREEILRQYCVQRGWDPEWCDPDNWPENPRNGH